MNIISCLLKLKCILFLTILPFFLNCGNETKEEPDITYPDIDCSTIINRPSSLPQDMTFDSDAELSIFAITLTSDQIITSGGQGVLSSVDNERYSFLVSNEILSSPYAEISIDYSFSADAEYNDKVKLSLNKDLSSGDSYTASVSPGGLFVYKGLDNYDVVFSDKSLPATGRLTMTVCNGQITAIDGSNTASITDNARLEPDRFEIWINQNLFESVSPAGAVAVDNLRVLVP